MVNDKFFATSVINEGDLIGSSANILTGAKLTSNDIWPNPEWFRNTEIFNTYKSGDSISRFMSDYSGTIGAIIGDDGQFTVGTRVGSVFNFGIGRTPIEAYRNISSDHEEIKFTSTRYRMELGRNGLLDKIQKTVAKATVFAGVITPEIQMLIGQALSDEDYTASIAVYGKYTPETECFTNEDEVWTGVNPGMNTLTRVFKLSPAQAADGLYYAYGRDAYGHEKLFAVDSRRNVTVHETDAVVNPAFDGGVSLIEKVGIKSYVVVNNGDENILVPSTATCTSGEKVSVDGTEYPYIVFPSWEDSTKLLKWGLKTAPVESFVVTAVAIAPHNGGDYRYTTVKGAPSDFLTIPVKELSAKSVVCTGGLINWLTPVTGQINRTSVVYLSKCGQEAATETAHGTEVKVFAAAYELLYGSNDSK